MHVHYPYNREDGTVRTEIHTDTKSNSEIEDVFIDSIGRDSRILKLPQQADLEQVLGVDDERLVISG